MNNKTRFISVLSSTLLFLTASLSADAASIRVRCYKTANRSKISVDGSDLAPRQYYRAQVIGYGPTKNKITAWKRAVGDEVEFDLDSNPADIRAGATSIPGNFIGSVPRVTGKFYNAKGYMVVSDTVACRRR